MDKEEYGRLLMMIDLLNQRVEKLERELFIYKTYTQYVNAASDDTDYSYVDRYVNEQQKGRSPLNQTIIQNVKNERRLNYDE